jgi:hypothetical protein
VLLAMVRKKAGPIGQNPLRLCRAGAATEEMGQERTFSPFETRNLTQQSRGSQPAPSPALPDREEAQRCHRDDDKDENRDKAQPNQVHFAQFGSPAASVRFETLVVLCICVLIPASSPDLFCRRNGAKLLWKRLTRLTQAPWALFCGPNAQAGRPSLEGRPAKQI